MGDGQTAGHQTSSTIGTRIGSKIGEVVVPEEGLGPSKQDRIVVAALDVFGEHGTAKSTLQMVAKAAGVSVGLVQHHFGSKDRLIDAVNTYALGVIRAEMSRPLTASPGQSVLEMGRRVSFLLSQQLTAVDYLARLLVEGAPAGPPSSTRPLRSDWRAGAGWPRRAARSRIWIWSGRR